MLKTFKPLIACTTGLSTFRNRIEAVADQLGSDFFASSDLDLTLLASDRRELSCVVVDFETFLNRCGDRPDLDQLGKSRFILFVVPRGDVLAAFQAASFGAIGVIEKPFSPKELVRNLKAAIASESRLQNSQQQGVRFASEQFSEFSHREKAVLALLMDGEPNKRVASLLDIGLRTVEAERAKIIKKMNAQSFVDLIKVVNEIERDCVRTRKTIFRSVLQNSRLDQVG